MSQEEITDFLKKYQPKWFTSKQISHALLISKPSINKCLERMRKHSEVREKRVRVILKGKLGFISKEVPFYSFKEV